MVFNKLFKRKAVRKMVDRVNMTQEVFNKIKETIGEKRAETGGMLGIKNGIIENFYFDQLGSCSGITYSPDVDSINKLLNREWNPNGINLIGFIHSHPAGIIAPSHGDKVYAQRILNAIPDMEYIYLPIVQSSGNMVDFKVYSYIAFLNDYGRLEVKDVDMYIDGTLYDPKNSVLHNFDRIEALYPLDILAHKIVIGIGTGGARGYYENLARSGVVNFILFDGDKVSETNIATQGVYYNEINRFKVEVIRERILNINPKAKVKAIPYFLDSNISDDKFEEIVGEKLFTSPKHILIAGCTDNFFAQARSARIALKYGVPYIAAQLYFEGRGAEVIFTYPGVTPACPRCMLGNRYKAFLEQAYKNDVTSKGTPIFATERMNSLKGYISMALLLYNEDPKGRFNYTLDYIKTRNFVQIRLDPFLDISLGIDSFKKAFANDSENIFFDETLWVEQLPDHPRYGFDICPDCGGIGDLTKVIGKIKDTRAL